MPAHERRRHILGAWPPLPPHPRVARIARLLGALPDLLTALACLVVWRSPFAFGPDSVKTIVLMMLMEFLVVHGTGFFTQIAVAGMVLYYVLCAAWKWHASRPETQGATAQRA